MNYFFIKYKTKLVLLILILFTSNWSFGQRLITKYQVIFDSVSNNQIGIGDLKGFKNFIVMSEDIRIVDSIIHQNLIITPDNNLRFYFDSIYYKQYVGFTNGELKLVYVNGSMKYPEEFLKSLVNVMGGGAEYYHSIVDISSRKVNKFGFNASR